MSFRESTIMVPTRPHIKPEYHCKGFIDEVKKLARCKFVQTALVIGIGAGVAYALYCYKKKRDKDEYFNTPKIH